MGYKRYKRRNYKNYNKQEPDIFMIIVFLVLGLYYYLKDFFTKYPVLSNIITTILVILTIFTIYFIIKTKIDKKKQRFNIKTIEEMKKLHWREFEKFIEYVFKQKGFKAKTRKGTNDGGIDIDAEYNGQTYLIQCKKWDKWSIGRPELQKFFGAVMSVSKDTQGIFVTTSRLTSEANIFAKENSIEIWDDTSLEKYVSEFTGGNYLDNSIPKLKNENVNIPIETNIENQNNICNKCGGEMVLRKANRGEHKGEEFYGCSNFPKCRNIIK